MFRPAGLVQDSFGQVSIEAETLILAMGRFLSGGLEAGVSGLRETLLDLPVTQPDGRGGWYRERYMDPRGHAVNRAGVEVDGAFDRWRPTASHSAQGDLPSASCSRIRTGSARAAVPGWPSPPPSVP